MQNTFGARTRIFSLRKLLSVVTLRAEELKLQFNAVHAWKPSIVTCFYPTYYPDFSACYFSLTIILEATVWKTIRPSHQLFSASEVLQMTGTFTLRPFSLPDR